MATTETANDDRTIEISIEDFSSLIVGMSRVLFGITNIPPFKEANIGLAEWVALSVLSEKDGVSNKQLARTLGVTGQRANQVGASLKDIGLISIVQSDQDSRKNVIRVTPKGKAQFDTLNTQLKPFLAASLKGKERSLAIASRHVKILMRIVHSAEPSKEEIKAKRKSAKAREVPKAI